MPVLPNGAAKIGCQLAVNTFLSDPQNKCRVIQPLIYVYTSCEFGEIDRCNTFWGYYFNLFV